MCVLRDLLYVSVVVIGTTSPSHAAELEVEWSLDLEDGLYQPADVCELSTGELVIADAGNNRLVFVRDGEIVSELGSIGNGPLEFMGPGSVVESDGHLFVLDRGNRRIQTIELATRGHITDIQLERMPKRLFRGPQSQPIWWNAVKRATESPAGDTNRRVGQIDCIPSEANHGDHLLEALNRASITIGPDGELILGLLSLGRVVVSSEDDDCTHFDVRYERMPHIRAYFAKKFGLGEHRRVVENASDYPSNAELREDLELACSDGKTHFTTYISDIFYAGSSVYTLCDGRLIQYALDGTQLGSHTLGRVSDDAVYTHSVRYSDSGSLYALDEAHNHEVRKYVLPELE